MNIRYIYNENGTYLQDIIEECLLDFYYEFYEKEMVKTVEK